MHATRSRFTRMLMVLGLASLPFWSGRADERRSDVLAEKGDASIGREIFLREWIAGDPRSHGGDGLGPVFNASSCVACHSQGGPGGAGGIGENVHLLSAQFPQFHATPNVLGAPVNGPAPITPFTEEDRKQLIAQLVTIHPGFQESTTVVLHRFGADERHDAWRRQVDARIPASILHLVPAFHAPTVSGPQPIDHSSTGPSQPTAAPRNPFPQVGEFVDVQAIPTSPSGPDSQFPMLARITTELQQLQSGAHQGFARTGTFGSAVMQFSQRNTTALWGAGLIDAIPERAIEAYAKDQREKNPRITGRVHRLPGGRIGRFGWKAQTASLHQFTVDACAVEVGLHVPGKEQAAVPYDKDYKPAGLDLSQRELDGLVVYLRGLPAPKQLEGNHPDVTKRLTEGERLFASAGCAACHVRKLGDVEGLYGDLLLHDMGGSLSSIGSYGVPITPSEPDPDEAPLASPQPPQGAPMPTPAAKSPVGPTSREWRTPPLWGVRDSAPYLHDGRAKTLEQAIAFHSGEGDEARTRFMMLTHDERQQVLSFLKSLVAPAAVAVHSN